VSATVVERSGGRLPYDKTRLKRLVVHVEHDFADALEAYRARHRILTMSDALRRLLAVGLETEAEREAERPKDRRR
jgi:hypothetical protein